jgi:glucosylceramidase
MGGTRNWATGVLLWNLALDGNSGPKNGGCPICRGVVTIDQSTGAVTYNGEYFGLGHLSLAARPGAQRIESPTFEQEGIESVAFLNPDGSKGLLVLNARLEPVTFKVRWPGLAFSFKLPPEGGPLSGGRELLTQPCRSGPFFASGSPETGV